MISCDEDSLRYVVRCNSFPAIKYKSIDVLGPVIEDTHCTVLRGRVNKVTTMPSALSREGYVFDEIIHEETVLCT